MRTVDMIEASKQLLFSVDLFLKGKVKHTAGMESAAACLREVFENVEPESKRPLPKGSVIEFSGIQATVVSDTGDRIVVQLPCGMEEWVWTLDGESCKVISVPDSK